SAAIHSLSLHDALPILRLLAEMHYENGEWQKARDAAERGARIDPKNVALGRIAARSAYREGRVAPAITQLEAQLARDSEWTEGRSEEHTSELQSRENLV